MNQDRSPGPPPTHGGSSLERVIHTLEWVRIETFTATTWRGASAL